jgi:hypothetical protein
MIVLYSLPEVLLEQLDLLVQLVLQVQRVILVRLVAKVQPVIKGQLAQLVPQALRVRQALLEG